MVKLTKSEESTYYVVRIIIICSCNNLILRYISESDNTPLWFNTRPITRRVFNMLRTKDYYVHMWRYNPSKEVNEMLSINISIHLSIYPFVYLYIIYLSIYLFIYLIIYLFNSLSIPSSIHSSNYPSIHISNHLSIQPSI